MKMRSWFIAVLTCLHLPLWSTYIIYNDDSLTDSQQADLFDLILKGEPPRSFYNDDSFDLETECQRLHPFLKTVWIPTLVWQLGVLHAFFHDDHIRHIILASATEAPVFFEDGLLPQLSTEHSLAELVDHFDRESKAIPNLNTLYFEINKALTALYDRSQRSDSQMLQLAIAELPPFTEWPERQFPFWNSPWIYSYNSAQVFYDSLTDAKLMDALLQIEHLAHDNGEWVLYRGYPGTGYPTTLQFHDTSSHALSFGSTLLGGTFFSLEAAALTYAKPHTFLALRVSPQEMQKYFRVGPLHPLVQMLVDGELFHAHTKIAAGSGFQNSFLNGYFMKCNQYCTDLCGYIFNMTMTPMEFENEFQALCERSGVLFRTEQ